MAGVCTGPGPCITTPTGHGGDNFVTRGGGFDPYTRAIINALKRQGHSEGEAVQLAIAALKRWAAGRGVTAATQARAIAALAHWEALKASAHLSTDQSEAIDLATKGAMPPLPGTDRPRFPINNHADVKKAVRAVGRAKDDHAKVRRHIIARAKTLGASHLIPDHWNADGSVK